MQLTNRQAETAEIVRKYIQDHEYSPSVREVAKRLGVTPNGAQGHLDALVAKGILRRTGGVARSLRMCPPMV